MPIKIMRLRIMVSKKEIMTSTRKQLCITEVGTRDTTSLFTMALLQVKLPPRVRELTDLRFLHPTIRVSLSLVILQGSRSRSSLARASVSLQLTLPNEPRQRRMRLKLR